MCTDVNYAGFTVLRHEKSFVSYEREEGVKVQNSLTLYEHRDDYEGLWL